MQTRATLSKDLEGVRVLLAEDGPDNRLILAYLLEQVGALVTIACDGQEAVDCGRAQMALGRQFDVVFMDIHMPVMDGCGATRELRRLGYSAPIVALTAGAMQGDREACLKAGCDDYMTKPVDRGVLISTCARWARVDAERRGA